MTTRTREEVQELFNAQNEKRQDAAKIKQQRKEVVKIAVATGVRFVHLRNIKEDGEANSKGGCTVCYIPLFLEGEIKKTNLFEMSIALCNPHELYNQELGRYHAAVNFLNKRTITLRRPNKDIHYSEFIRQKFSEGEYF